MAINPLRLRRALSRSYSLLEQSFNGCKARSITSVSAPRLLPALPATTPLLRRLFTSTTALSRRAFNPETDEIGPDTILFEGCDYNHWLITVDFPKDSDLTREQMIETYVNIAAQVFGSVEEAKKRIYALSTTAYQGFQVECSEETSEKFKSVPQVVFVLPDSYIDPVNKEYGGDKYVNGEIFPRPPPVQYGRRSNRDRRPPQQNYGPPQQNYGPPPPQQNYGPPPQQNYGPPPPQQNIRPAPQQNYGPPPPQQNIRPAPQQNYGLPPESPQPNFGQPSQPPQPNYRQPPESPQPNYGQPSQPPQPNYRQPPQQNYGPPPQQNYGPPPQQNYGSPTQQQQNYRPQPHQSSYGPPPQQSYMPNSQGSYGNSPNFPPRPTNTPERDDMTSAPSYQGNLNRAERDFSAPEPGQFGQRGTERDFLAPEPGQFGQRGTERDFLAPEPGQFGQRGTERDYCAPEPGQFGQRGFSRDEFPQDGGFGSAAGGYRKF